MKNLFLMSLLSSNKKTLLAIMLLVALFTASCRPERTTLEILPQVSNGSFRVETDYPYYYVVYKYGNMKLANTVMVRRQKVWQHEFTVTPGDSLYLEVHTITSNVQGSSLKADILLGGRKVKTLETVNECTGADCYAAKPLELSLSTRAE